MPIPPPTPGVLGLEMPHHPPQQHLLLFPAAHHPDADHRHLQHQPIRPSYAKGKQQHSALCSEDGPMLGDECGVDTDVASKPPLQPLPPSSSASPWQRMRWTDNMVRLLIMVVYCMGDDGGGGPEGGDGQPHPTSSCSTAAYSGTASATARKAVGGLHQLQQQQQKKGKWKSVSRAMMEKGFFVSPQQCEDKFNDLNKRFKRVNDILGRGMACRVVEKPSLLEAMDHLTPRGREEVRKLLSSKHLFFREMCAYHSSCTAAVSVGGDVSPAGAAGPLPCVVVGEGAQPQDPQQRCHHPSECATSEAFNVMGKWGVGYGREEEEAVVGREREEDEDGVEDDDYEEDHGDHHSGETGGGGKQLPLRHPVNDGGQPEQDDRKGFLTAMKRQRTALSSSSSLLWSSPPPSPRLLRPSSPPLASAQQLLRCELMELAGSSGEQQWRWVRRRTVELEERRVGHECRALQLQSRRFRWLRFSGEKEREMERARLENEGRRLENERMLLVLREKELDLLLAAREGGGGQEAAANSPPPKTGG